MTTAEVKRALATGAEKADDFSQAQCRAADQIGMVGTLAGSAIVTMHSLSTHISALSGKLDEQLMVQKRAGQDMDDALRIIMTTAVGTGRLDEATAQLQIAAAGNEETEVALARFQQGLPEVQRKLAEIIDFLGGLSTAATQLDTACAAHAVTSQTAAEQTRTYSTML